MDRNHFNFQRSNEVAAVFSNMADRDISESCITIRDNHTKALQYVSTMDPNDGHEFIFYSIRTEREVDMVIYNALRTIDV